MWRFRSRSNAKSTASRLGPDGGHRCIDHTRQRRLAWSRHWCASRNRVRHARCPKAADRWTCRRRRILHAHGSAAARRQCHSCRRRCRSDRRTPMVRQVAVAMSVRSTWLSRRRQRQCRSCADPQPTGREKWQFRPVSKSPNLTGLPKKTNRKEEVSEMGLVKLPSHAGQAATIPLIRSWISFSISVARASNAARIPSGSAAQKSSGSPPSPSRCAR